MVSVCLPSDALLQHLPSYLGFSYLGRGVSLHSCSSKVQPLLLTLNKGYLLTTTLPDLQRGIAPIGPPAPMQPRLLGHGVGPSGHRPCPQAWGCSSWPGMGEFNSDDHYIYYCGQESLIRNGVAKMVNKRVRNAVLGCNLKNDRMISVCFQGKPFNITVIQVYAPTSITKKAEVEWFYEDLQDLLELTPEKDVLFIIWDWNAKVGSQETPGVTGKFGLGIWNEAGQRLIEFCQENTLVIANTLFQQHKKRLYTWTSPDGQHRN